jgi:predicted amidohydrolase YtcJ
MIYQLVNARVFGKPKAELFNITINGNIISSIYPAGSQSTKTKQINLDGAWVAPAFIDAHVHLTNTGVQISGLDLSNCHSYEELALQLKTIADTGEIVIGHGWDDSNWARKADINVFESTSAAIYLSRIDAHSALGSMALLNKIPVVQNTDGFDPLNPIRRDAHGVLREFAYQSLTDQKRTSFIESAVDSFLANGVYQVHEMSGPRISSFRDAEQVLEICKEKNIQADIWWGELNGQSNAKALNAVGCGGDLFVDGSFGSKTAFIKDPYLDGGNGHQYISLDEAIEHILLGYEANLPTSFHVIGDAAIELATEAFEAARRTLGNPKYLGLQNRLEHVELLSDSVCNRLVDLNIVFSMQPQFSANWAGEKGMYADRIGSNWSGMNPFRVLLNKGAKLVFGSDAPVTSINPWKTIHAAMNMHNDNFSITQKSAFRAHTSGTDRSTNDLQVGTVANLAVWDVQDWAEQQIDEVRNRWSTDARSFPNDFPNPASEPKCLITITEGKIAYSRAGDLFA